MSIVPLCTRVDIELEPLQIPLLAREQAMIDIPPPLNPWNQHSNGPLKIIAEFAGSLQFSAISRSSRVANEALKWVINRHTVSLADLRNFKQKLDEILLARNLLKRYQTANTIRESIESLALQTDRIKQHFMVEPYATSGNPNFSCIPACCAPVCIRVAYHRNQHYIKKIANKGFMISTFVSIILLLSVILVCFIPFDRDRKQYVVMTGVGCSVTGFIVGLCFIRLAKNSDFIQDQIDPFSQESFYRNFIKTERSPPPEQ